MLSIKPYNPSRQFYITGKETGSQLNAQNPELGFEPRFPLTQVVYSVGNQDSVCLVGIQAWPGGSDDY